MIWLTWRQFRAQAITAVAALALFAILLAINESDLSSAYASSGLTTCHGGACAGLASQFLENLSSGGGGFLIPGSAYMILYFLGVLFILIAPAITGCFWGAPLIARELEAGTFRLTWNQSITRTRWLTVKLVLTGVAAIAVTEAFSLIQAWWAAPIGKAVGLGGGSSIFSETRFGWFVFPTHGITPLGYAAFAFALGVTAGALIRRTVPAMAVTLAIFAALQVAMPLWVRPHLAPADHVAIPVSGQGDLSPAQAGLGGSTFTLFAVTLPGHPGAWLLSSGPVNAAGQPVSATPPACASIANTGGINTSTSQASPGGSSAPATGPAAFLACLGSHGIRESITYQPANRYWPFQLAETGIYLAMALALAGFCFVRLNRQLS
jgi:ABC-type transport system involved in multi-copper enzyme maturation permease subunit